MSTEEHRSPEALDAGVRRYWHQRGQSVVRRLAEHGCRPECGLKTVVLPDGRVAQLYYFEPDALMMTALGAICADFFDEMRKEITQAQASLAMAQGEAPRGA